MNKIILLILVFLSFSIDFCYSQVGIGTSSPSNSAILELTSSSRGFLPPRMNTSSRNSINGGNFEEGLTIYNTDNNCLEWWNGSEWYSGCCNHSDDDNITPADGILVSDNFQDGANNAPFNLQVRNTTPNSTNWQAVITNKPYSSIPGLIAGNYTLSTTNNGDGTYTHTFIGTTSLAPYSGIIIIGGLPSPPGDGTGLSLFIP